MDVGPSMLTAGYSTITRAPTRKAGALEADLP